MAKVGGYLLIDHQASPGLPEEIAKLSGYDPKLVGEGQRFEADTLTCSHCKTVQIKNTLRTRPREHCFKCNHYICDACAFKAALPDYNHIPFEKIVDETLARGFYLGSPHQLLQG